MAYTPELSKKDSGALRRIAWALHVPMTKAMIEIFEHVARTVDGSKICISCKDESFCDLCPFNKKPKEVTNEMRADRSIWRNH
jgi:hypothetical protein